MGMKPYLPNRDLYRLGRIVLEDIKEFVRHGSQKFSKLFAYSE
jgi:hypothetical protein